MRLASRSVSWVSAQEALPFSRGPDGGASLLCQLVSWYHHNVFPESFDDVILDSKQMFVVDGNRITCAGGTGAIDLAGWMIERHLGRGVAQKTIRILQVDRIRSGNSAQP